MPTPSNALNIPQKGIVMFDGTSIFTQGAYPLCHNIGIAYSAGTFTVQGSNGTALSATNPGYVTLQNPGTAGQLTPILVTANQTFTDGSGGTTATQRFGLVSGNVWGANDIPFFLYAVAKSDGTAISFMISRNPTAVLSPAAASIGQSGAIVNVGQSDFFSLAAITASNYAAQPLIYIGCFRMQFTGATNSWTVSALADSDGVGLNYDNTVFLMPPGVQGAASGSYFLANGGTAPIWTTQQLNYAARRNGMFMAFFSAITNTTAGTTSNAAILTLPYTIPTLNQIQVGTCGFLSGTTYTTFGLLTNSGAAAEVLMYQSGIAGEVALSTLGSGVTLNINFIYKPY